MNPRHRIMSAMKSATRRWVADTLVGALIGAVVGAILAVDFVIYFGIEGGYEASIPDVFRESTFAGILTVAVLLAGPVVGVVITHRLTRRRTSPHH
jgi:hypothetical protein